jgi:hypothetical protein
MEKKIPSIEGIEIIRIENSLFVSGPRPILVKLQSEIVESDCEVMTTLYEDRESQLMTIYPNETATQKKAESEAIHVLLNFLATKVKKIDLNNYDT